MLILLFCMLATRPFVSMGLIDDWSYIWTARVLADTGRVTYNGWGAMPLGWMAYLGALFIKLFGFSFTIVRSSVMIVSLIGAALMQRVFVRTGAGEWTATIATLTLVLSPLYLPLSVTFMTDVPALVVLVLCIYCCLRAFQAVSDKAALGWLVIATLSNLAGGTVRQIAWLGALIIVPSAVLFMRRRRHILPVGATLCVISALTVALYLRWFRAQPYTVTDKIFYKYHFYSVLYASETAIAALACLVPVMSAFVVKYPAGGRQMRNIAAIMGAIFGSLFFWWAITTPRNYFSIYKTIPFCFRGNYLTIKGVGGNSILGEAPDVAPMVVRFLIVVAAFSALSSFTACFLIARRKLFVADALERPDQCAFPYLPNAYLVMLLAPFAGIYLCLIVTRVSVFDRYFLPLQFISTLGLIRVYRQTISERLPRLCLIVGFVYAAYAMATTHDIFALDRARLNAANEITATGIPRTAIEAGFEYDGWTQLEQTGYTNDSRILFPPGAYQEWIPPNNVSSLCLGWMRNYSPSLHPLLHLSHQPDNCFGPSQFAPVAYETWLPPRHRKIYILESH